jgi:L-alanine-DL-glutamate epimerase-like enolase superfamily enzyme
MITDSKNTIDKINIYNLKIPLKKTYHLSFGDIDFFETTLVRIDSADYTAFGESTPLFGYGRETNEDVWSYINKMSVKILHKSIQKGYETDLFKKVMRRF